tara:strand:+ start:6834 stop:7118 length:285 start_codon:yes stop_codon:yes gene_type:complete
MWAEDYYSANARREGTSVKANDVELDKEFTELARASVQGDLSRSMLEINKPNISALMVSCIIGAGVGMYLGKSPIIFGLIGGITGSIIIKMEKQ